MYINKANALIFGEILRTVLIKMNVYLLRS